MPHDLEGLVGGQRLHWPRLALPTAEPGRRALILCGSFVRIGLVDRRARDLAHAIYAGRGIRIAQLHELHAPTSSV